MSATVHKAVSDAHHVPTPLKEYDVWVVWCPSLGKTARAPWETGHMYMAEWAEDKPVNPRTDYNQASATASLPIDILADQYPFPDEPPNRVLPTILIPPKHSDCDLLFVDFDDVRNPETGEIPAEVWEIVDSLGGYTEISKSGEGLHVWVRGELPEGHGKVIADLETKGQIEMYDRGRMTGCTWNHVRGTPKDKIPQAQETINELVDRYADERTRPTGEGTSTEANTTGWNGRRRDDDSPYYHLDVTDVADTGAFSRYRTDVENPAHDEWQGPHPKHGGTSTQDRKSTNFTVDETDGVWHCFAHDTGGGALSLIAVLEGIVSCSNVCKVHQDRDTLLKSCLAARDKYTTGLDGEKPPYMALVAVAEHVGLSMEDRQENILGKQTYKVAKRIYADLNPSDV